MGLAAIGCAAFQKRSRAAPPNVMKAGTPSSDAIVSSATADQKTGALADWKCQKSAIQNTDRNSAASRGVHLGALCQRMRSAIIANPIGRMHCTVQVGTLYASVSGESRSTSTN